MHVKNVLSKSARILSLIVLLAQPVLAITPLVAPSYNFQYQRTVTTITPGANWIVLDEPIFSHSNLSDIRIYDGASNEAPQRVINQPFKLLSNQAKVIAVSSVRPDYRGESFSPAMMLDGNAVTSYQTDVQKDNGVTTFTVDLGESALIRDVFLNSTDHDYLQIESSLDNKIFATIVKKAPCGMCGGMGDVQLLVPDVTTRYLRFTFWYSSELQIRELKLYGDTQAKLMFYAEAQHQYTMYYGNPLVGAQIATSEHTKLVATISTPTAQLGPEELNPSYNPDVDGDGIATAQDNCPYKANPDQQDQDNDLYGDACDNAPTTPNTMQGDSDKDGVGDAFDNCFYIKNAEQKDSNLNGRGDVCDDEDNDGIVNSQDNCPSIANYSQEDLNNNGVGDACEADYDSDGIPQTIDNCRNVSNKDQLDSDSDRIGNSCDNCPDKWNRDQLDTNENKLGDACEADILDDDQDGVVNSKDTCLLIANPDQHDTDGDGIGNLCDNCKDLKNASQFDSNKDGIGDICSDDDQDGIATHRDNCPSIANPDQADANNDGIGDACEDSDQDGVLNALDNCKFKPNVDQLDSDRDKVGDSCDTTDNRWTEQNPWILWVVIGAVALLLIALGYRLVRKASQPELTIEPLPKGKSDKK